jgi:hypothetical protein
VLTPAGRARLPVNRPAGSGPGGSGWRQVAPVAAAGLALAAFLLALQLAQVGWSATAPFFVSERFGVAAELAARGVHGPTWSGTGYDGQWFLAQATDPLLRRHTADRFDAPRYRAGRPLGPVLAWLLAAGRPGPLPAALLAVGVLAVGLGCAAAAGLAAGLGRNAWWGIGFALVPGVVVGVTHGTAEPLGLALAVAGLWLASRRRLAAGLAFAGAALAKETYLVFGLAAALHALADHPAPVPGAAGGGSRRARAALLLLGPGVVALGGWWAYLVRVVPAGGGSDQVAAAGPPLLGWALELPQVLLGRQRVEYALAFRPGPLGAALVLACLLVVVAGTVVAARRRTLLGRAGLLLGVYTSLLAPAALGWFYSSLRTTAPGVVGAGLALLEAAGVPSAGGTPPGKPAPNRAGRDAAPRTAPGYRAGRGLAEAGEPRDG